MYIVRSSIILKVKAVYLSEHSISLCYQYNGTGSYLEQKQKTNKQSIRSNYRIKQETDKLD